MQRCPDCDELISSEAINIQEGFALCPVCGRLTKLSELNFSNRSVAETLNDPPVGCSIVPMDQGVVVRASLRSIAGFVFSAGFALFWNAIVSIFLLLAIAGLYANLIGPVPAWFPAPGVKDGKPEMNGTPMNLGETMFLCVFLIPFVAIGTAMAGVALLSLFGKVEVIIDEFNSFASMGIGFFVWKQRFDPFRVDSITLNSNACESGGRTNSNRVIELRSDRTIKFGSLLQSDRLEWMYAALKELMLKSTTNRTNSNLPVLTWIPRHDK